MPSLIDSSSGLSRQWSERELRMAMEEEEAAKDEFGGGYTPDTLQNKILLTLDRLPDVDWESARRALQAAPGTVTIEMAPPQEKRGSLYLPARFALNTRSDVGIVIASGIPELHPGDAVVVRAYDGTWREDFEVPGYKAKGQVRTYGVFVAPGDDGNPARYDVLRGIGEPSSILARLDQDMNLSWLGKNVRLRRDAIEEKESGIYLPINSQYRPNCGTVIECGSECEVAKVGMRCVYHPSGPAQDLEIMGDPDSVIIHEDAIELWLTGGEKMERYEAPA